MRPQFSIVLIILLEISCHTAYSKNTEDSAIQVLSGISDVCKKDKLSEKFYLDSVYTTMYSFFSFNIHFTHKELLALLGLYRGVIGKEEDNNNHKRTCYAILSNQAQMSGRDGKCIAFKSVDAPQRESDNQLSLMALTHISTKQKVNKTYEQ